MSSALIRVNVVNFNPYEIGTRRNNMVKKWVLWSLCLAVGMVGCEASVSNYKEPVCQEPAPEKECWKTYAEAKKEIPANYVVWCFGDEYWAVPPCTNIRSGYGHPPAGSIHLEGVCPPH